jgi:hypothetical protein
MSGSAKRRVSRVIEHHQLQERKTMTVKNVTYTEIARGMFVLGFQKMETHQGEMLTAGWRVQAQIYQPAGPGSLLFVRRPGAMLVTYVKG